MRKFLLKFATLNQTFFLDLLSGSEREEKRQKFPNESPINDILQYE